jgi:glyoxalase family protein
MGYGLAIEVSLEVPPGSLAYWGTRLEKYGAKLQTIESRFGDRVLPLVDPHGLRVALVESASARRRAFAPWDGSPIPPERQVRGLYGAQISEQQSAPTTQFLTNVLGFKEIGTENGWTRYGFPNDPGIVDVREERDARRGAWGIGTIHHLAWSVKNEEHQLRVREQVGQAGGHATEVIDRFWFKSVYFREPGGVLFEIATEGPGFAIDESRSHLGESLVLPPFLESQRAQIERVLPPLTMPAPPVDDRVIG